MTFYLKQLAEFLSQLAEFLKSSAPTLPSGLRYHVMQALILLVNRQAVNIQDTLAIFMELQSLGDRNLRELVFSHVGHSIRHMNQKHKNESNNRPLQHIVFSILQAEDETRAGRSLTTMCELHWGKAIAVGLNVIREICLRMPLLLTEDLLQVLLLYKKSHEKAISAAAHSLISLFREVCPSLLVKKDRGHPIDPKTRPRAYGEVNVASNALGVELLQQDDRDDSGGDGGTAESALDGSDDDHDNDENITGNSDEKSQLSADAIGSEEDDNEDTNAVDEDDDSNSSIDKGSVVREDDGMRRRKRGRK